jgi:hypothetical protein
MLGIRICILAFGMNPVLVEDLRRTAVIAGTDVTERICSSARTLSVDFTR